jgi:YHS domain-containing protein
MLRARFHSMILLLGTVTLCVGCNAKTPAPPQPPAAQGGAQANAEDEIAQALAKLEDPSDREAAKKQEVCPVSDHALGSMGAPVKVAHDGKDLFLCCESCKEEFEKDPATFVAKLKK